MQQPEDTDYTDDALQRRISEIDTIANNQKVEVQEQYEMMLWWKFTCQRMNVQWIKTSDESKLFKAATHRHISISYLNNKFGKPRKIMGDSSSSSSSEEDLPSLSVGVVKRKY